MIIRGIGVSPSWASIRFRDTTAVLDRSCYRLPPPWLTDEFYGQWRRIGTDSHDNLQGWLSEGGSQFEQHASLRISEKRHLAPHRLRETTLEQRQSIVNLAGLQP